MAVITWPAEIRPRSCSIGYRGVKARHRSPFNGTPQTSSFNAERLVLSVGLPIALRRGDNTALAGIIESLLNRLTINDDWVTAWHFAREAPVGTMRGSPTLSATASRGNNTLAITGGTASGTLKRGDMLGAGGWLFQVAADITLNGSGAGTVSIVNRVRATIASGTALVWDKPTANFATPADVNPVVHIPAVMESATLELEEVWTP